jgi:signal peptidase
MCQLSLSGTDLGALAAEILEGGSALRFRAHGASMRPFIRDGDVIEVQPVGAAPIRRGDVVLCRNGGGRVVAHRVIQVGQESGRVAVVTQGDALARPDRLIFQEQVLGRVVAVERGGRRIRLDVAPQQLMGVLWIRLSPLGGWLYRLLAALRRRVRCQRIPRCE